MAARRIDPSRALCGIATAFDVAPRSGKPWGARHFELVCDLELAVPLRYDHDRIFDLHGLAWDLGEVSRYAIVRYPTDGLVILGQIAENGYGDSVLADLRKSLSNEFFAPDWSFSVAGLWGGGDEDQVVLTEVSLTKRPSFTDARLLAVGEDAVAVWDILTEERAQAA